MRVDQPRSSIFFWRRFIGAFAPTAEVTDPAADELEVCGIEISNLILFEGGGPVRLACISDDSWAFASAGVFTESGSSCPSRYRFYKQKGFKTFLFFTYRIL